MEKFTRCSGVGVPLRRSNVDTDQIIPAVFLKRITRSGFEDGLFAAWRSDPEFILNRPPYDHGAILVAGPDFGTGSSREHAVWALQNFGFKAVVSSRFGDIFKGNAGKAGLVTAELPEDAVEALQTALEAAPGLTVTVDLEAQTITSGELSWPFGIDAHTRRRLLDGLDDISLTLQAEADIARFEAARPAFKPVTLPV
ncbi:MAG: 3-isopropylmalate dehydratase small subunit [Propionibacteriaceae bacterium]|jgi:3-isopropylmalate/(R)-2-methylmalate dehydratase small subunit|nr:3-isopropylmalate dehydratase small subunit [Propionibacteriaceae bacterium]